MAGKIPREFIDDLLVRVDIVDLIDSHVPLKKTGGSYTARCPFHAEKSPSFSVNRAKQFYHCFGCGVGGNAINFLIEFSHLSFVEAIEDLAGFVGIDVPRDESNTYSAPKQDTRRLYAILEQVAVFYVDQLRNHVDNTTVVEYLKNRDISGKVAQEFSLGYAPDEWNALGNKFDKDLLLTAGMLVSKEGGGTYDRFRGRLMFPIRDKRKRIIGFGGRVLDDALPKYLNSPETPVFSKGRELYGLYELLEKRSKPKRILLVEGYMDVLALSQFDIPYSVAVLGTAPSKTHLDLLFRFTSEIVFCFDGDSAGEKAAWRAIEEAFPALRDGRQVRIMLMPAGQDPDSLVREKGVEGFEQQLAEAQSLSDYFFESLCKDVDMTSVEGKSLLISKAKPHIEKIPLGIFRDMMALKLNELSLQSVPQNALPKTVTVEAPHYAPVKKQFARANVHNAPSPARIAIALLLQNPVLIEVFNDKKINLSEFSFPGVDLLKEILHVIDATQADSPAVLLEHFRGNPSERTLKTLINWEFILSAGLESEFSGALDRLVEHAVEDKLNQLLLKEKNHGLDVDEKRQLCRLIKLSK
ncbi:MAG: DNA primase [Methylococcales bacterium]|nr:DNA primase [Methylococcales bacterium]